MPTYKLAKGRSQKDTMMKTLYYLLFFAICLSANACDTPETDTNSSEVQSITNIFVVRHADRPDGIDTLNQSGIFRAKQLADVLRSFELDAVFSSPFDSSQCFRLRQESTPDQPFQRTLLATT